MPVDSSRTFPAPAMIGTPVARIATAMAAAEPDDSIRADAGTTPEPACCASEETAVCCAPAEKPGCCGPEATTGGRCGCS